MKRYYDLDTYKASIEQEREDRYVVTIKDSRGSEITHVFKSEAAALREILSYTEIDGEDYEEEQHD